MEYSNDVIPMDQKWFWTEEWQAGEREASAEIAMGDLKVYNSVDELFAALDDLRCLDTASQVWALTENDRTNCIEGGFVRRHTAIIVITVMCALGLVSSIYSPLAHILNVMLLVAVIGAAVVSVSLFTYLIGTSLRAALRARRGG